MLIKTAKTSQCSISSIVHWQMFSNFSFVFLFPLIKKKIKGVIVEYGRTLEIAGKNIAYF